LVSSGDHEQLQEFLESVVIDVIQVYDDRGFTLAHIAASNNDHKTLDVLIASAFDHWDRNGDTQRSRCLQLLNEWVNEPSRPP